ncbi:MAG TPA: TIGR01458 family HAD-type hydrolase [Solirubrobacterales bacterium]|jgi:HAD superfamily hydrolase (TIGR01458 family)|nr:TIGR01458 family HAD-type hydrolase [Solirubrobacterales bacterium]
MSARPPLEGAEALLLDLSGVIYVEDEAVPGAADALAALRSAGIPIRLVTNTTMRPRRAILDRLERLGIEADPAELLTPATLAKQHCEERGYESVALVVLDELREDLDGLGERGDNVEAVIVGDLGERWDYSTLNGAFRLLMDGAELVALQRNRYWETAEGLSLDAGPFVAALEYGAGAEATVVGKPAPAFFELALSDLGVGAGRAAMVGDDVEADVGGALDAGLRAVLVRTGKYREERVRDSGVEPTATVDSIADVPALLPV